MRVLDKLTHCHLYRCSPFLQPATCCCVPNKSIRNDTSTAAIFYMQDSCLPEHSKSITQSSEQCQKNNKYLLRQNRKHHLKYLSIHTLCSISFEIIAWKFWEEGELTYLVLGRKTIYTNYIYKLFLCSCFGSSFSWIAPLNRPKTNVSS